MKRKPEGWKNESYRHSLASHGIKTGKRSEYRAGGIRYPSQRVDIYGMEISRWRCPECYRGLKNDSCIFHGRVESPLDITKSRYAQEVAIDLRIWNVLGENPHITIPGLAERIGMDEPALRDFLNRISDEVDGSTYLEEYRRAHSLKSRGDPIILGIKGRGSFDGDVQITLEGAEELLPLLQSRGVGMQALSAFNSTSGTQKIDGRIEGIDVNLTVTHPGEDLYHVEGDMYYHIDRTFTRKELKGFYEKAKRLM